MGSGGNNGGEGSRTRPPISRRSCDQCRARKIGCDRASPCSNCTSARLDCTHSAIASNTTAPRQRVSIAAQYEQKIDGIARDIDGIKALLQELNVNSDSGQTAVGVIRPSNQGQSAKPPVQHRVSSICSGENLWDHSAHIIDFIKAIVADRTPRDVDPEASDMLSSLEKLVHTLESPVTSRSLSFPKTEVAKDHAVPPMPPVEAVVAVLRWANEHAGYTRIAWISNLLPLQRFADICRKVYFAVDDYSEVELILTNGYLSYIISEYVIESGLQKYREYYEQCRANFFIAVSRLPLLLPASMEMVAVLTLAAYNAIENSKATMAWTYISAAADLCLRLGYHRAHRPGNNDPTLRAAQDRLFWAVYTIDRGFALRVGRLSTIRDSEITLPLEPDAPRATRLARLQGKVYDQLYSPEGLSRPDDERGCMAEILAEELRGLLKETDVEIADTTVNPDNYEPDPMRVFYLQCDQVCHSALLALILRADPAGRGSLNGASDDFVAVARDTLDLHQQCIANVRGIKNDPLIGAKYINWAILHTPFVPFSILFTRTVQFSDVDELARLDRFAASLRPEEPCPESISHPYRLYELLCKAARLYVGSNALSSVNSNETQEPSYYLGESDLAHFGMEGAAANGALEAGGHQMYGLSDWYYSNQQIMNLLDEDMMF